MTIEGYCFPTAAMAVVAVSGGVVLVAFQAHKRLLSGFMERFESELIGYDKDLVKGKKKVRFVKDVMEPSENNKEYRRKRVISKMNGHDDRDNGDEDEESTMYNRRSMMPKNRMVLYQGILDYKVQVKGRNQYHVV